LVANTKFAGLSRGRGAVAVKVYAKPPKKPKRNYQPCNVQFKVLSVSGFV